MEANVEDVCLFVHSDDSNYDKQGLLLVYSEALRGELSSVNLSSLDRNDEQLGVGDDDDRNKSPATVQAVLVGNIFAFWDCTLEKPALREDPGSTCVFILERPVVHLKDPSKSLPFPFSLSFEHDEYIFDFSAFTEEDQQEWMLKLSGASREVAYAHLGELAEKASGLSVGALNGEVDDQLDSSSIDEATSTDGTTGEVVAECDPSPAKGSSPPRTCPPNAEEKRLVPIFLNPTKKTHRFTIPNLNGPSRRIVCEEWMYECRLSLVLPMQLLKLFKKWTLELKTELETRLGYLPNVWRTAASNHQRLMSANLEFYNQAIEFIDSYNGGYFRPSMEKFRLAFSFVPVNLHLQRFSIQLSGPDTRTMSPVVSKSKQSDGSTVSAATAVKWIHFDCITSGSCSAIPMRYQNGGLRRLRCQLESLLETPENIDSLMDGRFSSRRSALNGLRRRIGSLNQEVESNWNGDQKVFQNGRAGYYLLSELKEVRGMLTDFMLTFPGVSSAVDLLAKFGQAEKNKLSHSLKGGTNGTPFVVTDSLDTMLDNLDALLVSLTTKIDSVLQVAAFDKVEQMDVGAEAAFTFEQWIGNARVTANRCLDLMLQLIDTLVDAQLFRLLSAANANSAVPQLHYQCQLRTDVVFSMALTTTTAAIMGKLALAAGPEDLIHMEKWWKLGPTLCICSLLSCYGDEKGMLEDKCDAWRLIRRTCRFRFIRNPSSVSQQCIPLMEGNRSELLVSLPLPEHMFSMLPNGIISTDSPTSTQSFKVYPILWNVGVNHEASFAQTMGDPSLERQVNLDALSDTLSYVDSFVKHYAESPHQTSVTYAAAELSRTVKLCPSNKNMKILKQSAALTRLMNGNVLLCCKSGKDRTGLAVTLHEGDALRDNCGVTEHQASEMVVALRRDGVRLENCRKNVGKPVYRVSPFQMHFLPKDLRPPAGTFGSSIES